MKSPTDLPLKNDLHYRFTSQIFSMHFLFAYISLFIYCVKINLPVFIFI